MRTYLGNKLSVFDHDIFQAKDYIYIYLSGIIEDFYLSGAGFSFQCSGVGVRLAAQHLHIQLILRVFLVPRAATSTTAGRHDGHAARPPDPHHLGADEQHQAGGEEAAAGDGEEHEEGRLGVAEVVAPHHECLVVGGVVAGEPGGRGLVPAVLPVQGVELAALELESVDTTLVVDVQHRPAISQCYLSPLTSTLSQLLSTEVSSKFYILHFNLFNVLISRFSP